MKRINRREAVTFGLATPLTFLAGRGADARPGPSDPSGASVYSTGYFKVPGPDSVLIGLLLPAVQKVREAAARLLLVDSAGQTVLSLDLPGKTTPTPVFLEISWDSGPNGRGLVVKRAGADSIFIPSVDGILIGLLLPAVQRGQALLAGSVQVLGDGSVRELLPYVEQDNVYRSSGGASHSFAGPFSLAVGGTAQIGLLLPAVQKVREAARLLLLNSQGSFLMEVTLPTDQAGAPFVSAFVEASREADGSVRVVCDGSVRLGDGSVREGDGSVRIGDESVGEKGILIGLLLPAVQRNGRGVGLLGGSLQLDSQTVGLTEVSVR